MPRRTSVADRPAPRVVVLTLDAHRTAAFATARERLAREVPGLSLALHVAATWAGDPAAAEAARADVAQADIVVATHLFAEDQVAAIVPALEARRDGARALVGIMSAPEVMRCTRMGRFQMGGPGASAPGPWSPVGILRRLSGGKPGQQSGEAQMRQLRRIPQLLRFIPGPAQDVRCYYLALQYWLAGSDENLVNLVRMLLHRYARDLAPTAVEAEPPAEYPETGVYHPDLPGRGLSEWLDALPASRGGGRVGVVLMRSYLLGGNRSHYDAVIRALEARGLDVIPAFAAGLDARPAIAKYFRDADGRSTIDALVSLTGFSLVGGPAFHDADGAREVLAALDVPYLAAPSLEFQTVTEWQQDARGLTPVEATLMVAIPELDGATTPVVFGGRQGARGDAASYAAIADRADRLAGRVARMVALRRSRRAERRVGIVLFNFPPNAGNTGTAAYLAVFESLHNLLRAMAAGGYRVEVPGSVDELRERITRGNAERYGAAANVVARLPVDDHVRREPHLAEIEAQWGPAPGRQQTDGSGLLMLGARFGQVLVTVQPSMGYEGDPMRLLFERGFAPTHAFSAFYRWLREDERVDALLHFGTHGALEFMPGKQAGLGAGCWPDRLLGDVPNVYLYASNNPSEGTLAKRRSLATLVSYLTPPIARAGLYRGLADLRATINRWRGLPPGSATEREALAETIQAQAAQLDLVAAAPEWNGSGPQEVEHLRLRLDEIEQSLIPTGLHVVGAPPSDAERRDLLDLVAEAGAPPEEVARVAACLAEDPEIPALLAALDGRYVPPVPGGDLLRSPAIVPTGRNLYGFDPFRMPTPFAMADGRRQADALLSRHVAMHGSLPDTVAIVLWGTDNMKSEGAPLAQALALLGARPRVDYLGRLTGAELVPLEELGRPRIDVLVTLSGIFRDLLPLQVKLLAEAAWLAASADEPPAQNRVRANALAHMAALGCDLETAALRVFSNAEGAYGSNVNHLVDSGTWQDDVELAETFVRRKGFAYGASGRAVAQPKLFERAIAEAACAYQNLDSVEYGVTDLDHYYDSLGAIAKVAEKRGASVPVYVGDQTRGSHLVRTIDEQVSLESRTRLLNPRWYEGMLKHGYEGVRLIETQVSNTFGWSATTAAVPGWVYTRTTETFVLDAEMRDRLAALNPHAVVKLSHRLLEAHDRGFWQPDEATLAALRDASADLEDRLEGVLT